MRLSKPSLPNPSLISSLLSNNILATSVVLSSLFLFSCNSPKSSHTRPNVIVILTDDQGWGDFSIHGNTNIETPNIDQLAMEGAQMENFFVCSVCSPTRAEFLTGRYHFRGGVYNTGGGGERLDLDERTLADAFSNAGYRTAAYGKWHNGMQYPYHPNARGFEDFYGFCSGHWGHYYSPMLEHNGQIVKGEGFIVDDLTEHGMAFMETHQDEPFFLYLAYNTPHDPLQAPDKFWDQYKDRDIDMFSDTYRGEVTKDQQAPKNNFEDLLQTRAALAMCANIDWNVGRVTQKLEELGLAENTIVMYFNDNGPNHWRWNGGMKGKKGSTDEGGVRSPLFIRWPAEIDAGSRIGDLASVTDLYPTLLELCGVEDVSAEHRAAYPFDGQSFAGIITGDKHPYFEAEETPQNDLALSCTPLGEDRFILNLWGGRVSIRSQEYRLDNNGGLFHIPSDPGQSTDLSAELPERWVLMQDLAADFKRQIGEEIPDIDPRAKDLRPFYLGHPDARYTQMPARDAMAHGHIERSNRWPNCSYFSNWTSMDDSLSWEVEVPATGTYKVELYYTCPNGSQGSALELAFHNQTEAMTYPATGILYSRITEAHDPPLEGADRDLYPRDVSEVKDWKILDMGTMELDPGKGFLTLKATEIPGPQVMDFRLLQFERLD